MPSTTPAGRSSWSPVGLWVAGQVVLVATLVPTTVSLTALHVRAPAAVVAALAATVATGAPTAGSRAGGSARHGSRPSGPAGKRSWPAPRTATNGGCRCEVPGPLLAGPLLLAWLVAAAGVACRSPAVGRKEQWVASAASGCGAPGRRCRPPIGHTLARRWLVFVPTGVVVHDPLALAEPVLLRRADVRSFGPAPADATALDLTRGALGLASRSGSSRRCR